MLTKIRCSHAFVMMAIAGAALPAVGNPDGGEVVEGSAEFIFGDDYLRILTGELTIIDWLSFNIDAGYTVEFLMPGIDSRVLNRITSGVPTEIMGNLLSNGQVFIVNPSGVIFGQGAVVNVGALYAAAGNLSNADFVAGVNRFTDARGIVENRGHLQGDLIALVGGRVANHGTISAPNGTVVMAAGEQVLIGEHLGRVFVQVEAPTSPETDLLGSSGDCGLDMAAGDVFSLAAWNTGTVDSGSVTMHGGSGRAVVSGQIDAVRGGFGGEVTILGAGVELRGATIDASGDHGGGSIVIGGNPHADINADRSGTVFIDEHSIVSADALVAGDGGSVVVWSDEFTNVEGSITARGGSVSGDGGFIETSGLRGLRISQMVDATAVNGRGGHWLIDPTNIIIAPGFMGSLGGFGNTDTAIIGVNLINNALNAGMDVTLTTLNPLGNGSGEIIQMESAAFRLFSGGEATLTLNAAGSILLHGGAFATNGSSLNLVLNAADPNQPPPADPFSNGRIEINEVLSLGGGSLLATGNSILVRSRNISDTGTLFVDAGEISLVARGGGDIFLGADMTASRGMLLDGQTTLINDVSLALTGPGEVTATGVIRSDTASFYDLRIDASSGVVTLAGGVGDSDSMRLGDLDVAAGLVRVGADVRVLGDMNFFATVSVFGESVTFHTGLGTALFAGDLYSELIGASDVAFEYDGEAWAGNGQGRTPFKFQGNIGVASGPRGDGGFGGAFRNIQFGSDLTGSPTVATFLFANAAASGLDLTSLGATNLMSLFQVAATDSIRTGRGQKITSFGSLSMLAQGADSTLIEVGDLTVVGDLSLRSLGSDGQIRLLGRIAGTVDGTDNEDDRAEPGISDDGAELIAMGSIFLEGQVSADPGAVAIGANGVILANETGGSVNGLPVEIVEGGAGIDRFLSTQEGSDGLLYAYDLAAFAADLAEPAESTANLAEATADDPDVRVRSDDPLLADRQVLAELGFATRVASVTPREIRSSGVIADDTGAVAESLTLDRLSRKSVQRMTGAYERLLGSRIDPQIPIRTETVRVRREIMTLWTSWQSAGRPADVLAYARSRDSEMAGTLWQLNQVLFAIDLLELTPAEIRSAREAVLTKLIPDSITRSELSDAWFPLPKSLANAGN
ncbi:MAG: filamentous hemagglutinin N-terminal domain-containing protein [Phycisphaerales bacterium]